MDILSVYKILPLSVAKVFPPSKEVASDNAVLNSGQTHKQHQQFLSQETLPSEGSLGALMKARFQAALRAFFG